MKTYVCIACGFLYDELAGDMEHGIPPGTRWEDVPDDWCCPECGLAKKEFDMVELE